MTLNAGKLEVNYAKNIWLEQIKNIVRLLPARSRAQQILTLTANMKSISAYSTREVTIQCYI
jgi:hypothetical protein